MVDGEVVDRPQFMVADQKVELHADATLKPILPMTLLLNMPTGFDVDDPGAGLTLMTPDTRMDDDGSDIRTLKRHFSRLLLTAPLEAGATGLLVFTQDKRVEQRLINMANRNEQEYVVEISGEIEPDGLDELNGAMKMNGWPLPSAKVSWQNETRLRFALKNILPGQIEFMCNKVGLTVVAMTRIRIGRVSMAKLPPGQWRYLPEGMLF